MFICEIVPVIMKNSILFLSLHVIQYAQVNNFSDTANDTN